jgi:hypothetical protein
LSGLLGKPTDKERYRNPLVHVNTKFTVDNDDEIVDKASASAMIADTEEQMIERLINEHPILAVSESGGDDLDEETKRYSINVDLHTVGDLSVNFVRRSARR